MEGSYSIQELQKITRLIRYWILRSTTKAGSGHPTSSLSATDLMVGLMFGGFFRFNIKRPNYPNNDRLVFSKGHASPLFYALWAAAGAITAKELMTMRKFGSPLEGHPVMTFPYTEAATGSLGQGLSVGVGMALNAKYIDQLPYKTYVLLGDSEMAEGSVWEAIQLAAHYKLDNLIGIVDVNRLGQRGQTMYGHKIEAYKQRIAAFGWKTITINGHSFQQIISAYQKTVKSTAKPVMIIAKTIKGKGVTMLEDKNGWHGIPLKPEQLGKALKEIGAVNMRIRGEILAPERVELKKTPIGKAKKVVTTFNESMATRKAYGYSLVRIFEKYPDMVVLDAEVSNSTYSEIFKEAYPKRFFEMYIAEQNMVGMAIGLSRQGKIPFISTFAAFFTRAYDQIRMSQYSKANIKFCGSHAGVSIGEDGPSQMGLEDLSMFRSILGSVVFYPSDAVATDKLVEVMAKHKGLVYMRTTRSATPIIYNKDETFRIGGSKVLKQSDLDVVTVVAAGITLHEALAAYKDLKKKGKLIRVIDLYSIKPIDTATLKKAAKETKAIITVEDHFAEGGIGEAVRSAFRKSSVPIISLAVKKMPKSGKPVELLDYEGISKDAIIKEIKKVINKK